MGNTTSNLVKEWLQQQNDKKIICVYCDSVPNYNTAVVCVHSHCSLDGLYICHRCLYSKKRRYEFNNKLINKQC